MDSTTSTESKKEISLLDSLSGEWLKLPTKIMSDVGPATQTFAGVLMITNRETFVSVKAIAARARLPIATVRKHLVTLHDHGWIVNAGRERTRAGRPRRTCTIKLTTKAKAALRDYSYLPLWACCSITKVGRLPWSTKAVLSIVMGRLAAMKSAIERQDGTGLDAEDFWGSLENMGGEDRFRFSIDRLERETGLHRESVVDAKRRLASLKMVDWLEGNERGQLLIPNKAFRVVVTPASEGRCFIAFSRGSETGQ